MCYSISYFCVGGVSRLARALDIYIFTLHHLQDKTNCGAEREPDFNQNYVLGIFCLMLEILCFACSFFPHKNKIKRRLAEREVWTYVNLRTRRL